ncbi:MAG: AarF/ABC1/UbiB kinase family protein [Deltaproteobacteria bacterium]|nr:MAG: AarF/ABC1/UbiB kinase family protein [Deltaproteobacteria bacterium]
MRIVRPLVDAVGDLGSTVRNLARMREVAAILVRNGFGRLVDDVPGIEAGESAESSPPTQPERVAAALVELGPTYVKLGQVLSTRPDVLPPDYVTAFEKLQDNVTSVPWASVEEVLVDELGLDWRERFARFDQEPLATASIAQAHTARLTDGTEVVLKVQRPGIAAQVDADLQILRFLLRRAVREWPELEAADPEGLLLEFDRTMRGELDFHREAEHMRRFRNNFAGRDDVVIPELFDQCITGRVICMSKLEGTPIRKAREAGFDMEDVGRRYLSVVYEQILIHGFFHGDLHPGNVFVMPDGALGLIDFGMVGTMTDKMRSQLVTMMFALQKQDPRTIARVLYDIAIKDGRIDFRELEAATIEVIGVHFPPGLRLQDLEMSAFCVELVQRSSQLGAKVPTSYMMVLKAIVTAEGLAKTLLHETDPIAAAQPYFAMVAANRLSPEKLQQEGLYALLTLSSLLDRVPVSLGQLLDDLDAQRLSVGMVGRVHPDEAVRLRRAQTRWLLGGFAGACLVAGAMTPIPLATGVLWGLAGLLGLGAVAMR